MTVEEIIGPLARCGLDPGKPLSWPPDVYGVMSSLLLRRGGYLKILQYDPRRSRGLLGASWPRQAHRLARAWVRAIATQIRQAEEPPSYNATLIDNILGNVTFPKTLRDWWHTVLTSRLDFDTDSVLTNASYLPILECALKLLSVADEASAGIGFTDRGPRRSNGDAAVVERFAEMILIDHRAHESVAWKLDPHRLRILPKQHTPQRGLSIRSFSHNLARYEPGEIRTHWTPIGGERSARELDLLNLLLLPWPLTVASSCFQLERESRGRLIERNRYFTFRRTSDPEGVRDWTERMLNEARSGDVEHIDGLVFPEGALDGDEFAAVEDLAIEKRALLIAGIGAERDGTKLVPVNRCYVQPIAALGSKRGNPAVPSLTRDFARIIQGKHHRWCLDRNQILQYGLGGRLPASSDCWELVPIDERAVTFQTLTPWLTLCVLICEDLAQQDPMAEIMRAVGPTLVIALLLDGPQLSSRWPSRYASVLADDPGCSVLTLSCLGMTERSRPRDGQADAQKARTVGLWRDVRHGVEELVLPPEHEAGVLSLVRHRKREFTPDGRGCDGYFPVFAGWHTV